MAISGFGTAYCSRWDGILVPTIVPVPDIPGSVLMGRDGGGNNRL